MKTQLTLLLITAALGACAQQYTEKISKELTFEKPGANTLMIFNINGSVSVTGYSGDKVLVEVQKTITGKTERRLEIGKKELQLGMIDRADTLMLFVEGTCSKFGRSDRLRNNGNHGKSNGWGYLWEEHSRQNSCNEEFDYRMNFVVKVPSGCSLYISTINDGDLSAENVSGSVYAGNINGSVSLKNLAGATDASTINGSVDIEYASNPPKECRYYSLNGDINAWFRKGLTANLSFESFNGGLYTNVEDIESLPVLLERQPAERGLRYKIAGNRFKIGKGGVLLDFETFNGNAYLKEKQN